MGQTGQLPQNGQLIPKKANIVDLFVHQFWTHSHIQGSEHGAQSHLKWVISMVRGVPNLERQPKNPKRVCLQTHLYNYIYIYMYIFIHLSQTLQKSPLKLHRWSNHRFCPCGVAPLRCNVWWSRCQLNAWWKMCFPVECEGSWWLLFFWIWTWCFLGIGSCFVQFGQGDFWMFSWA